MWSVNELLKREVISQVLAVHFPVGSSQAAQHNKLEPIVCHTKEHQRLLSEAAISKRSAKIEKRQQVGVVLILCMYVAASPLGVRRNIEFIRQNQKSPKEQSD